MHRASAIAAVFGVLVAAPATAGSEEAERRLTVHGGGASVQMDAYGTRGSTFAAGGGFAFAYGVRRWLDVSVSGTYLTRPDVELTNPAVPGVSGSNLVLFANLHTAEAAAAARVVWVGPHTTRWHPLLEIRSGVAMRMLTGPQIFSGGLIAEPEGQTDWIPFVGASAGVVYRWTDHLQVGVLAASALGTAGHRTFGASLELSWQAYSLL